ncbi:MAG: hypothetical protein LCH46_02220 [Proteobacteria bacterium]|nr:hypothetical protein [Pseudomonadota bacterium]
MPLQIQPGQWVALALFLTIAPQVHAADWEGVFEGTLGKSKVIVELNAGADASDYKGGFADGSRYSYYPKLYDLNLVLDGGGSGAPLAFTETTARHMEVPDLPPGDPKITGRWSISVDGKGATGTWASPDGKKKLPISLRRVPLMAADKLPPQNSQLSATYNGLWFRSVSFEPTEKTAAFGGILMTYMKDSAFGQEVPVFSRFPDGTRMEKANAVLMDYYKQSLMGYRDCVNGVPADWRSDKLEVEYQFEAKYASPAAVSIEESGSVFCGGAHPSNYATPLTFDLETMTQIGGTYGLDLSPDGFGHVLKLANKEERAVFESFALDRWNAAASAAGDSGEDSCAGQSFLDSQPPGEREFSLSFLPDGLAVRRTDFPHVASNCLFEDYNPTVIPWADLKPWLRPGQTLLTSEMK